MTGQTDARGRPGLTPTRRSFLSAAAASAAVVSVAPGAASAAPRPAAAGSAAQPGHPAVPQRPAEELRRLLREVDPGRIQASILVLVGFGTRHTLSSQDDPNRGIGAA